MKMLILNVYAPDEEKELLFNQIAEVITTNLKGLVLVGGDFNTAQSSRLDMLPPD